MPPEICLDSPDISGEHNWVHSQRTGRRWCNACGEPAPAIVRIHYKTQLQEVAEQLGVRPDWHEPDEQEVTAHVGGQCFDNAGFWPESNENTTLLDPSGKEMYVELRKGGLPIAQINLATLFAMACGTFE